MNDRVEADQLIMEVETQKATLDVPSPTDGFIRRLCVNANDEISEKALLCLLTDTADEPISLDEDNEPSRAARSTDCGVSSKTVRELGALKRAELIDGPFAITNLASGSLKLASCIILPRRVFNIRNCGITRKVIPVPDRVVVE